MLCCNKTAVGCCQDTGDSRDKTKLQDLATLNQSLKADMTSKHIRFDAWFESSRKQASLWLRRPKYQSTNFQRAARQVVLAAVLWRSGPVTHVRNFLSPFLLCPTGVTIYLPPATGRISPAS